MMINWKNGRTKIACLCCTLALAACGGVGANDDSDGDSIRNGDEGFEDTNTDGDEFPDYLDLDSDGDGIPDADEAGDEDLSTPPVDTDGDETPDYLDLDSDDDNISDTHELSADFAIVDSDSDGIPDYLDDDSDDDGIPDRVEAVDLSLDTQPLDSDGDGDGDFRDLDSDGDCIPDSIEAGADPLNPVDSDADGRPNYRDLDSDNDGLIDSDEDKNCNGVLEAGESSPSSADTDGDGTPDLIEVVAGADPNDPNSAIPATDFYFVLPFQGPGASGPLDFSTNLRQADIFFSVDTTGSFGEEIAQIQSTLSDTIIPGVSAIIPDAGFGVGRFEDLPLAPFGLAGDLPFELLQPITTDAALIGAGIADLPPASGGLDIPESGIEALFQWATGLGLPGFGYPAFSSTGIGGVGFRPDSLPIIIQISDAVSHPATDYPAAAGAHTYADAVGALTSLGIRVIGVDSLENVSTMFDPRAEFESFAIDTKAVIPPDGNNECSTGVGGSPRAAVDIDGSGTLGCPLVFDVAPDGSGLGSLIVDAIAQLASFGTLDISTDIIGQPEGLRGEVLPTGTTTADFLTSITPVAPAPAGATIDGDIFRNVTTGSTVTFDVQAFNDFVPGNANNQLFAIDINVVGDLVTVLDVRRVFVIVPKVAAPIE